jgi:hypothetical protein
MGNQPCKIAIALLALCACGPAAATDYYIDYANGNDAADGTSPSTAWKHAPGDPDAFTGNPPLAKLMPGDTVFFKGGVKYQGKVKVNASGAPGNPITFSGTGYGTGSAIMDGARPVTSIRACPSAAECDGHPQWQKISIVTFKKAPSKFVKLYDRSGFMYESQWPTPADPFRSDDITYWAESPVSDKAMIEAGRLRSPELARILDGEARGVLQIWVFGNLVERRKVTGIDGDYILFAPDGIKLYGDRPGRYALLESPRTISGPGQYAVAGKDRVFAWLRASAIEIGTGNPGFQMSNRSNIRVTGFIFRRQTAADDNDQLAGASVVWTGANGSGLTIDNNLFESQALFDGKGAIDFRNISNVVVKNNVFSRIERGSGIRIGPNGRNITVSNNRMDEIGRTGIMSMGSLDSVISDNVLTNITGVHGNGMSLYLSNRRIRVVNNSITTSDRPMTFHGDTAARAAPGDHDFVIERNIFIANPVAQAALTSWGANTRGVTIRNNVLIGPKGGILTNVSDQRVSITKNYVSQILFNKVQGPDWVVADNVIAANTVRLLPNNPVNDAMLCTGAGVAPGVRLGGILC